jgi:hypothetical protein
VVFRLAEEVGVENPVISTEVPTAYQRVWSTTPIRPSLFQYLNDRTRRVEAHAKNCSEWAELEESWWAGGGQRLKLPLSPQSCKSCTARCYSLQGSIIPIKPLFLLQAKRTANAIYDTLRKVSESSWGFSRVSCAACSQNPGLERGSGHAVQKGIKTAAQKLTVPR